MLAGKVAAITGAASGIGEAVARLFVKEGARVVLGDIQGDKLRRLADELGTDRAMAQECDVSQEADLERLADAAVSTYGSLGVWCSNAGCYHREGVTLLDGLIENLDTADFDRQVAVNLRGVALGTKHAARAMKRGGRGGCIINTTSIAGLVVNCANSGEPVLVSAAYSASKHGIVALTKLGACELAPYRIRVNAVAPGYTATPMLAKTIGLQHLSKEELEAELAKVSIMPGVALRAEDIANGMLYLASDMGRCVNGHTLVIDNGLVAGVAGYVPGLETGDTA